MRPARIVVCFVVLALGTAQADAPIELEEDRFDRSAGHHGVVLLEVNWGRQWGCAGLDNAQLQALTFSQLPGGPALALTTPSRLFVDNRYKIYALLAEPGEYILTGFDVKVAKSVSDVGHRVAEGQNYGSFDVAAGEFVYIGHFGLDCTEDPIPWRYYIEGTEDFERYVAEFRERFPFVGDVPVEFRLFSTDVIGTSYSLATQHFPARP